MYLLKLTWWCIFVSHYPHCVRCANKAAYKLHANQLVRQDAVKSRGYTRHNPTNFVHNNITHNNIIRKHCDNPSSRKRLSAQALRQVVPVSHHSHHLIFSFFIHLLVMIEFSVCVCVLHYTMLHHPNYNIFQWKFSCVFPGGQRKSSCESPATEATAQLFNCCSHGWFFNISSARRSYKISAAKSVRQNLQVNSLLHSSSSAHCLPLTCANSDFFSQALLYSYQFYQRPCPAFTMITTSHDLMGHFQPVRVMFISDERANLSPLI